MYLANENVITLCVCVCSVGFPAMLLVEGGTHAGASVFSSSVPCPGMCSLSIYSRRCLWFSFSSVGHILSCVRSCVRSRDVFV